MDGIGGEAEAEAEAARYYNLKGYLTTITSSAENNYIKDRIRKADNTYPAGWTGGSDIQNENTWRWMGGPEDGQIFFSDDGNCTNDSWVIPWLAIALLQNQIIVEVQNGLFRSNSRWGVWL